MGFGRKAILAAGLGFVLAAVVGCGSTSNLLSSRQANDLAGSLSRASQALSDTRCAAADDDISDYQDAVNGLSGVDQTLVENLNQGGSTIAKLAQAECPVQTTTTQKKQKTTTNTNTTTTATETNTNTTTTATETNTNTTTTATTTGTTTTSTTPTTTSTTTGTTTSPAPTVTTPPPSGGQGLGANDAGYGNAYGRFGHGGRYHGRVGQDQ